MKIKYLGTAAFEGIPTIFCQCDVCKKARELGGKELRSRSQALIDGDLLVDFPADTLWHVQRYGLDFSKVKNCIITHSHSDHLYPADIEMLRSDFCHGVEFPFNFFSGKDGYFKIKKEVKRHSMQKNVNAVNIKPYKAIKVGDYTVTPYKANHSLKTTPFVYRIEKDGKSLFYGNDSGVLSDESFGELKKGKKFDLVSFDCTGAFQKNWKDGHLSLDTVLTSVEKFKSHGLIDDDTIVVVNHFSHNGLALHWQLEEKVKTLGLKIIVAYDGLEISF